MATILFYEVSLDNGVPKSNPCMHQSHEINGVMVAVDPLKTVAMRITKGWMEAGVIAGTNSLTPRSKGYYVAGTISYPVTDSLGVRIVDYEDATHQMYCEAYSEYLNDLDTKAPTASQASGNRTGSNGGMTFVQKMHKDKMLAPPTIEDDGWYVNRDLWYYLVRNRLKLKNTLLVGNSGTGKTELLMLISRKQKRTCEVFDMAVSNPNKTFCGSLRAENGSTYFQLARYATALRNEGDIIQDELSRASPASNNILLPQLDSRRILYIEEAIEDEDRQIKMHEKAMIWATANIGSEFIGTNMLDHALLNRFLQVGIDYPPPMEEAKVLSMRTGISKRDAGMLVDVAEAIRKDDMLSKDISTRQLLEVAEAIADGYSKMEAFTWTVLQQFETDKLDGGERAQVRSIIQSK